MSAQSARRSREEGCQLLHKDNSRVWVGERVGERDLEGHGGVGERHVTRGEREEHYVLAYAPTGKLGAYAVDRDGDGASDLVLGFSYAPDGEWIEQAADFDGDGVNDTRQFMEGGRVVRIERREEGVMKVLRVTGWDETGRPTGFEESVLPSIDALIEKVR